MLCRIRFDCGIIIQHYLDTILYIKCLVIARDVPPPDWVFTFTKVSNHQVVLHGRKTRTGPGLVEDGRVVNRTNQKEK